MQQPQFRGLCKETNDWVFGFGWCKTDYTEDYLKELGQTEQDAILYTDQGTVLCRLESMGQYTQQRDRDNQELYEGDICFFTPMLVSDRPTFKGVIEWDKYRFCIRNLDYDVKGPFFAPLMDFNLFGMDAVKIGSEHDS